MFVEISYCWNIRLYIWQITATISACLGNHKRDGKPILFHKQPVHSLCICIRRKTPARVSSIEHTKHISATLSSWVSCCSTMALPPLLCARILICQYIGNYSRTTQARIAFYQRQTFGEQCKVFGINPFQLNVDINECAS